MASKEKIDRNWLPSSKKYHIEGVEYPNGKTGINFTPKSLEVQELEQKLELRKQDNKEKERGIEIERNSSEQVETSTSEARVEKLPIKKLEVVKPKNENSKFSVVVNEEYLNPIQGDNAKPSWEMLFEVADGKELTGQEYKSSLEYFNTNKRCKLYTQTGCSLTKIFKTEYYIIPAIPIEMISDKQFKQRQNIKSRKTT